MPGEILEQQRRQPSDESRSLKPQSLKHQRLQRHNRSNSQTHNSLSPAKTSAGIHALSVAGLSAASYAHLMLPINPQLLAHLSASAVQHRHFTAGGADREGHELRETGNQEAEDVLDIHQELGRRTVRHQEDPRLRSERVEETEGVCDSNKVAVGRKVSRKHKSKWGRETTCNV